LFLEICLHFYWQCIVLQNFMNSWVMMYTIVELNNFLIWNYF